MENLLFTCPVTGAKAQGTVAKAAIGPKTTIVPVDCPICHRPHLIDPRTGKVPQGDNAPDGRSR
jgi:hypothetical protein